MARCKYERKQYQVSYDGGSTWEPYIPETYEKGDVIESPSPDCEAENIIYRWRLIEGSYICDGDVKYEKEIRDESLDNGVTWYVSYPATYRKGTEVGVDEEYCADKFVGHYEPNGEYDPYGCPSQYKWDGEKCVYVDPLKVVKCDGNTTLISSDVSYYSAGFDLVSCEIGGCVTTIGNRAFNGCQSLTNVDIPNNVTRLDDYAFTDLYNLTGCTIGSGLTSIGERAFNYCSGLTSIDIPDSVTSIGNFGFCNCQSLTSCTMGSGVTSIGWGTFFNCYSLTRLNSNVDGTFNIPSGVTSIGETAFYHCGSFSSVTIPDSVTSIGFQAFEGCGNLRSIHIPSGVTSIGASAFSDCHRLRSFTFDPSASFEFVNNGGSLFESTSISNVLDFTNVVNFTEVGGSMFQFCGSLTKVIFPATVTHIGNYAFNTSGIFELVFPYNGVVSLAISKRYPLPVDGGSFVTIRVPENQVANYKANGRWKRYLDVDLIEILPIQT